MRNPEKDLTLVARSKRKYPRQHKSVEQLLSVYRDMVYTFCARMIRNPVNAEDLPQKIFTDLLLKIDEIIDEFEIAEFEGRSAFSSWHYLVTSSHCLNFLFSCRLEDAHTDTLPQGNIVIDAATDLSQQDGPTQSVLAGVDPDARALLVMNLNLKEISKVLEIAFKEAAC